MTNACLLYHALAVVAEQRRICTVWKNKIMTKPKAINCKKVGRFYFTFFIFINATRKGLSVPEGEMALVGKGGGGLVSTVQDTSIGILHKKVR